jgi:hypothetical protein
MWRTASQPTMGQASSATRKEPEMHSLTTLEFANTLIADAERHWLYGHPYRSEPQHRAYVGIRRDVRRPGRVASFRTRRALAGRRTVTA